MDVELEKKAKKIFGKGVPDTSLILNDILQNKKTIENEHRKPYIERDHKSIFLGVGGAPLTQARRAIK